MFTCSLFLCRVYCFIALFGGINELLSPALLFFPGPPEFSSFFSCWRFWDPLTETIWSVSSHEGACVWVHGTGVWRSLSWANLQLIPNLHFPSFLYNTHILLPPIWDGLDCIVRGTCFCKALSFWSAWVLKGLVNTLLSEWVWSNGGGSLLGASEPINGAGRVGWPAALGADGILESCDAEESSSVSDSLCESLEPESCSNKKLRVLVLDEDSPHSSAQGLRKQWRRRHDSAVSRYCSYLSDIYICVNAIISATYFKIENLLISDIVHSIVSLILGLWRQSVANQRVHVFNDLAWGGWFAQNIALTWKRNNVVL